MLACSGRVHEYYYNSSDFYQKNDERMYWSLPATNAFLLLSNVIYVGSIVMGKNIRDSTGTNDLFSSSLIHNSYCGHSFLGFGKLKMTG